MPGGIEPEFETLDSGSILYHAKVRRHGNYYALQQMYYNYILIGQWGYNNFNTAIHEEIKKFKLRHKKPKKKKPSTEYETRGGFRIKKFIHKQPNAYYQHKRYEKRSKKFSR